MTASLHHRLEMLRAGTREAHDRIETVPAIARLQAPDLTEREYVAVLRHLEAFHAHVEPSIAARLKGMPAALALLDGSRPCALAEDLVFFDAVLLHAPLLPALEGAASALGALYVVEGSSLCVPVIASGLTATLGVRPGAGGNFFCGQEKEATRSRWVHFCAVIEAIVLAAPDADDRIVAGARTTFDALEQWLRAIDVAPHTAEA